VDFPLNTKECDVKEGTGEFSSDSNKMKMKKKRICYNQLIVAQGTEPIDSQMAIR
jgi:hypothetical protein